MIIYLAKPRGFCAGVLRAINTVEESIKRYGTPIYVRHQIVHNEYVVNTLEKKGVMFVDDLTNIPKNSIVIFSAHGVSPKVYEESKAFRVIDATCPLVRKVHLEAKKYRAHEIILIGHIGHQEVIGTMGETPMHLVERKQDIDQLKLKSNKIVCLSQTTLSVDDTKDITDHLKTRYPGIVIKNDICYATQSRQTAVKHISKKCELVIIIGSKTSSNSVRLVNTAKKYNKDSYLIDNKTQIKKEWLSKRSIGISAGASVPEILVQEVITQLNPDKVTEIKSVDENIRFPLPAFI